MKTNKFVKNISYTILSNLITMLISVMVITILPKTLGIMEYGYFQLYLFYSTYIALLHFGWSDGVYIRYGGKEYRELDKHVFFSQFWMLVIFEAVLSVGIMVFACFYLKDQDRGLILYLLSITALIIIPRGLLQSILQATNRVKEYSGIIIMEKGIFFVITIVFLLCGNTHYKALIIADIIGKLISFLYTIFICRDLVIRHKSALYFGIQETLSNIRVGINILFAYIASTLIIGIAKLGIEHGWGVTTFGKISLTLSISNLVMAFIGSIGLLLFPLLRRMHEIKLLSIYKTLNTLFTAILLGSLVFYFPLRLLIKRWLPEYTDSLVYMRILFPIGVFEGKMSLLVSTYLKTLRKEKLILFVNLLCVFLSLLTTGLFTLLFKNLIGVVISILILIAFRCILSEVFIAKLLKIYLDKDILAEISMSLAFLVLGGVSDEGLGVALYLTLFLLYLFVQKKHIYITLRNLKRLMA